MAITIQQMVEVKDKEEAPDTATKCCYSCEAKGTLCKKMRRKEYYEMEKLKDTPNTRRTHQQNEANVEAMMFSYYL
jgi:hypothetical protein